MNRFFSNLREDKLVERNNVRPLPSSCSSRARADSSSSRSQYFFQVDEHLGWSEKTNGTEAIFDHFHKGPQADLVEKTREVVHPTAATRCVGALSPAILYFELTDRAVLAARRTSGSAPSDRRCADSPRRAPSSSPSGASACTSRSLSSSRPDSRLAQDLPRPGHQARRRAGRARQDGVRDQGALVLLSLPPPPTASPA